MSDDFAERVLAGLSETVALYALADRLNVKREGPPGWGLELARALAREHVAEFKPPKKPRMPGRPTEKTLAYKEALATAIAVQEHSSGQKHGAAAAVARFVGEHETSRKGRRPTQRDIANKTKQTTQDAAHLSPAMRFLAAEKVRLVFAGVSGDEIARRFAELEKAPGETEAKFLERTLQTEIGRSLLNRML